MFYFIVIILVTNFLRNSDAQTFISPCPNVFQYDSEGVVGDRWYGTIKIRTDSDYSGIWMRTVFDRPFPELGTEFGEAVQREPSEYLIKNPKRKVQNGELLQFRIFARFNPGETPPRLVGFRLNARTICPENGIIETTTQSIAEQLISPCPSLFKYELPLTEPDKWYGEIKLKSDKELSGVWLRVLLDKPSTQLGNWFGEVTTNDNIDYLVKNRNHKLKPGQMTTLRFYIKYNSAEPIPKLKGFRLNAETVCPNNEDGNTVTSSLMGLLTSSEFHTQRTTPFSTTSSWITLPPPEAADKEPEDAVFGSDFDPNSKPIFIASVPSGDLPSSVQCGVVAAKPRPLITHGETTVEGQWPWHAALYYPKGIELQYICGASLISLNHILTVAHCVARKNSNSPLSMDDLEVFLGKYNLRKFSTRGIQNIQVRKITMHPDYNYGTYGNDIALIQLNSPAQYTEWVRPVCLWAENPDISSVLNKEGTVVGWGYDQTGRVTEQLTKANMPVVPHQTCIWSYPDFFSKFTSNHTFCAGYRNGTSVCNGDSGGGLVFPKKTSSPEHPVWQLRGLVSISVALQSQFICDTSHYAVFTDVAKYLDWIKNTMRS